MAFYGLPTHKADAESNSVLGFIRKVTILSIADQLGSAGKRRRIQRIERCQL